MEKIYISSVDLHILEFMKDEWTSIQQLEERLQLRDYLLRPRIRKLIKLHLVEKVSQIFGAGRPKIVYRKKSNVVLPRYVPDETIYEVTL